MIEIKNIEVMNLENAIRGMRNPLNSWNKSDSRNYNISEGFVLGDNDKKLALKLIKAGSDHSKFMRQILVCFDITAPLYWWKEMDQYKLNTTTNSESTMHTIHKQEITPDLFSVEKLNIEEKHIFTNYCEYLEELRLQFVETKDKKYWDSLIQMLPSSFNQLRTWTGNYQNLRNIYHSRKNHKLSEWIEFCRVIGCLEHSALIIL